MEGPLSSPPLVLMRGLGVRGIMSAEFNPLLQMRSRLIDLLSVELVKAVYIKVKFMVRETAARANCIEVIVSLL